MLFVGEFCTAINRAAKQNPTQYQNSKELAHKKTKSAKTELDKWIHKYLHYAIITKTVTFKFL